ncbi:PucR family transcriptional regulator [Enterococcus gallinarum]|uniref:PucR family transcriptional regulator n=1 Tax=Enterococcus gallinarum TaxID=1353 RepID=UPI001D1753B4|nr:helix-turn-helix domain-containing protein [Enterococcus gallinarum]MCC4046400.1 helix-turn-helix domain-containing protein [Enterococcus gallinarum]
MNLEQIFKEFIIVVQENPKYTIGLIDNYGKVISCSDEEKAGSLIDLSQQNKDDHFYKLTVEGKDYGYLWVNGQDDSLSIVANLLSESLKTRIIFEMNQEAARQSLSLEEQLIKALITTRNFRIDEVVRLSQELHIDGTKPRVAIRIVKETAFDVQEVTDLKYKINEDETIYSLMADNEIIMFKVIPKNLMELTVKEYLDSFIHDLQEWGLSDCYFYVGSVQNKTRLFQSSYQHTMWLKENLAMNGPKIVHFWDYVLNYLASRVPQQDITGLFDYLNGVINKIDTAELISIARQLYINDYNLTQTAESLFLHKNTLVYKIKRFEELFHIDIRGSFQGKIQFYLLANYLSDNDKREQAGEIYE